MDSTNSSEPTKDYDNMEHEEHDAPNSRKRKGSEGGSASKKQVQQESSWVWEHFTRVKDNTDKCNCQYCGREMACPTSSGTSSLKKHLKTCKKYLAIMESKSQSQLNQEGDGQIKYGAISKATFHSASNELLVLAELPLSFIDSSAWRYFCSKCKLYKPHFRRTATRDIVQMFVQKKSEMRKLIGNHRVSLTTDIWKNQNTGCSYMVITSHWVDDHWKLRKLIIGFKNVADHKRKTISNVLIDCLADWNIKKVFTITVDNASANSTALKRFKDEFKSVGTDSMVLGGEYLHMRCAAHIINLVVRDRLKEVDSSVAAIRNGITYVRSSGERQKSFELRIDNGRMSRGSLPLDITTRWNSTYLMLTRGLKFRLAFEKMEVEDKVYNDWFEERIDGTKMIGPPKADDWEAISNLVKFLKLFYHSTLAVSASETVNSYKCYAEILTIERSLIALCKDPNPSMREKAKAMRLKFDKYWDCLKDINKLLIVASVLNPTNKMCFATLCFEELYGKESSECQELDQSVNEVLKSLFQEYKSRTVTEKVNSSQFQSQTTGTSSQSQSGGHEQVGVDRVDMDDDNGGYEIEKMDFVYKKLVNEKGIKESSNELDLYLKEPVENPNFILGTEFDVLSWWRLNSPKYPILSELAKDVFAMQVSSVASESAFSTSGRVLDPYRSCLTHYTIEVLMCREQCLKSSIHLRDKAEYTTEQLLAEIVLQDQLEKEFNNGSGSGTKYND